MRAALAVALLLMLAPGVRADLGDVDTALGEATFDEVQISPDGGRLAFIVRRNDFERDREAFTVWLLDLSHPGARPVRLAEPGLCNSLRWSPDGRSLSFLAADDPAAGVQIFLLEPSPGAVPQRLTDPAVFQNGIDLYAWLPDGTGLVAVAADPPDPAAVARLRELYGDVRRLAGASPASSLHRISRSGKAERLGSLPFAAVLDLQVSADGRWAAVNGDQGGEVASANQIELLPLGTEAARRRTHEPSWKESMAWAGGDLFVSGAGEEKGERFLLGEARLFRMGTEGQLVSVAPGLAGYLKHIVPLADGSLLVTASVSTLMRVSRVEPGSGKVRTLLDQRGWIFNLSASRDGKTIAFVASDARHFPEIYVAQGPDGLASARPVTDLNAALTSQPLPEAETVSWDDGAGGTVEGALFWPPGRKGEKGLPLMLDLHGGPFSVARTEAVSLQGTALYFPTVLAARGFLVLTPNYRGSAGRGDEFVQGIVDHRCSRPSEDVIRGVESLIARGWADRQRVGLMGYSGGGGLSKCLIGRTDLFRAVSTGAGVWNDVSLFGTRRGLMWAETFFGGKRPWEDADLWWNESPIGGLGRVKTPTLILAGERDGEAPAQAEEVYRGLVARGVTAELLIFPGEGHIFTKPSHKRTKMRAEISWLEHYLLGKPRAELPAPAVNP